VAWDIVGPDHDTYEVPIHGPEVVRERVELGVLSGCRRTGFGSTRCHRTGGTLGVLDHGRDRQVRPRPMHVVLVAAVSALMIGACTSSGGDSSSSDGNGEDMSSGYDALSARQVSGPVTSGDGVVSPQPAAPLPDGEAD